MYIDGADEGKLVKETRAEVFPGRDWFGNAS